MATKKTPSKKKAGTKASSGKLTPIKAKKLRETIKLDELSQSVGSAVNRALVAQDLAGLRGRIIMGIIYDPQSKTFTPYFQAK